MSLEDTIGYEYLSDYQINIIKEALLLKSGGLSIPMGGGKTFISIILALIQSKDKSILVVVQKTLISSWIDEINKFFNDKVSFIVFHREFNSNIDYYEFDKDIKIVITIPETISKSYKNNNIEDLYILNNTSRDENCSDESVSPKNSSKNTKISSDDESASPKNSSNPSKNTKNSSKSSKISKTTKNSSDNESNSCQEESSGEDDKNYSSPKGKKEKKKEKKCTSDKIIYNSPKTPFISSKKGLDLIYSVKWGCLIIDEAHEYTNILVNKSRSIASIYSKRKWCLSGTLFNNPRPERIFGYYMLINSKDFPNTFLEAKILLKSKKYKGYMKTVVFRETSLNNTETNLPLDINVIEHIINTDLSEEEIKIYLLMKDLLEGIHKQVEIYKKEKNTVNTKKFNAIRLSILTWLRECVISPLIPISSISLSVLELEDDDEKRIVLQTFLDKLKGRDIYSYLNNKKNLSSSKINSLIKCTKKHKKIVIFSCFRTIVDLLMYLFEKKDRNVLTIKGSDSIIKRQEIFKEFSDSKEVILLLTYDIGGAGLNLQSADTIMLIDYDWNYGTTSQAIARVVRQGQKSKDVNVYFFVSNTGIEKAIFKKQSEKLQILKELSNGPMESKVSTIKTEEIITIILDDSNEVSLKDLKGEK